MEAKATVESLKSQGDGVINDGTGELMIPFVLAGEEVKYRKIAKDRAELVGILTPSPDRIASLCPYFTACGGCKLQHLSPPLYETFKVEALKTTLSQRGIKDLVLKPLVRIPAGTRRRATFTFSGALFGFNEGRGKRIIPVSSCLLLTPELSAFIKPLSVLCRLFGCNGDVFVTQAENGFDVTFITKKYPPLSFLEKLGDFGREHKVARFSHVASARDDEPELLLELQRPFVTINSAVVYLPFTGFLQPSVAGQTALTELVLSHYNKEKKVADLFCGMGSFTIPLAAQTQGENATVQGYDIAASAISVLNAARVKGVSAFTRNLYAEPLSSEELNRFDLVVLDPPRSGAFEQAKQLADSEVRKIIYVSCNPATFARDAAILTDAGYILSELTPVDQFVYSPHLELVAVFTK